jgi:hypothetical protein
MFGAFIGYWAQTPVRRKRGKAAGRRWNPPARTPAPGFSKQALRPDNAQRTAGSKQPTMGNAAVSADTTSTP